MFSSSSCKRNDEPCHDPTNPNCENYNPCYGKKPVKAELSISQHLFPHASGDLGKIFVEDTVFPQVFIRFNCPLNGAKYTWTLGAETLTSQWVERGFVTTPLGTYTVKLAVEKEPDTNCFPNDNGKDTVTKAFSIVPFCKLAILGVFKGRWDNVSNQDSSIISIRVFDDQTFKDSCPTYSNIFRYTNLQGKDDTLTTNGRTSAISNTLLFNSDTDNLTIGDATFKILPLDKTVVFDYFIGSKHYVFRGRKISD